MKKIIAFNWKMNPLSLKEAISLFEQTQTYADLTRTNTEIIIIPPLVYLPLLTDLHGSKNGFTQIKLGSQNVFWENSGHYTGEISPIMLKNIGVEYVIIGHSERRQHLNETDEMINKKVLATLKAGLKVILCIGENLTIRKKGKKAVENFIKSQLEKNLKKVSSIKYQVSKNLIVAYEPIWAIGGNHSNTPQDAVKMIKFIKKIFTTKYKILNTDVLYGGSINSKNIKNFIKYNEIDGFLVGHASLKPREIKNIIKSI